MTPIIVIAGGLLLLLVRRRRSALDRRRSLDEEHLDLLAVLVTGLEAGLHPMESLALVDPAGGRDRVAVRVSKMWNDGASVDDCLAAIAVHFDGADHAAPDRGSHLASVLGAHLADGQPLRSSIDELVRETDNAARRAAETRVRELPVRLAPPLVLCILPSFVLASVLPLAAVAGESLFGGRGAVAP